jgi:DMSO reductase family type II enzyme molybdopterin subunit
VNGEITRRSFIKGSSAALVLSLLQLRSNGSSGSALGADPPVSQAPTYRGFKDVYRERWAWDRIGKSTHFVNCWFQRGCSWDVYVKDGIAWREEQTATYPQTNQEVPDFNPRGCNKGACYSDRMYDASRLTHPLKRVGKRGEGKWQRISWEQALREIGEACFDVIMEDGTGAVQFDEGTAISNGCNGLGLYRTFAVLDTPFIDMNAECGDHHPGVYATTGKLIFSGSMDDLFYSDLILCWGSNPTVTQIPNAHFINEARYKGARVISIAPDLNPSSVHSDRWIPVNPGADAALGLAAAHVLIEEGLYDAAFVSEQTDMPLLLDKNTGRFLREKDLKSGGADDVFYLYDKRNQRIAEAPKRSLDLGGVEPALEGDFAVETKNGSVTVTPVFASLRRHLLEYTPEAVAEVTGISPKTIREFAREVGNAKAAILIPQASFSKYYHGLEMERAQLLLLTLAGHVGKKGSGLMGFPYIHPGGVDFLAGVSGSLLPRVALRELEAQMAPTVKKLEDAGYTEEMIQYSFSRQQYIQAGSPSTNLFFYFHGGLDGLYGSSKKYDPYLKRELKEYLEEAFANGWQADPSKVRPRIFLQVGGNTFRRIRGQDRLVEEFLPKLEMMVTVDWRMSYTALLSDYVLPAAGWYEKDDITWSTTLAPFAHPVTKVVEPLGEARSDWAFHCLFLKELQRIARERGVRTCRDRLGKERRIDRCYDEFTFHGRYREDNPEDFLREIFKIATNLDGISWDEIKEKGFARYTSSGTGFLNSGNTMDWNEGETLTANTWQTKKKQPWPTLTRRIQFCIDHPFYEELGEVLPVHKDDPAIGGDYPLHMVGGHSRWTIHASWREQKHMLQLNRGRPTIFLSPKDAKSRGIEDGDTVRVFNDIGSFVLVAKVSAAARPGTVIVYHAWEPYQFENGKSNASAEPAPINPIQLSGGHFHLQPMLAAGAPGSPDRGTRVEVERDRRRDPDVSPSAPLPRRA